MGDSHLFAPLGTPPATSPPLAASPLADRDSSGWGGKLRQGCMRVEISGTVGLAARRASGGPWMLGIQTRTFLLRSISKGQDAAVTERQVLAKPAVRVPVLLSPPQGKRSPPLAESCPRSGPGRHRAGDTGVSGSWSDFFSHKTALKKEMRSGLFCG